MFVSAFAFVLFQVAPKAFAGLTSPTVFPFVNFQHLAHQPPNHALHRGGGNDYQFGQ